MVKEKSYDSELPVLEYVDASQEPLTNNAFLHRRRFRGTTNSEGRIRFPTSQIETTSYPYGITVRAFQDYDGDGFPSGVGDAVFVIEEWNVIGIVQLSPNKYQWNVNGIIKALRKKDINGNIQGNLLDNARYGEELPVGTFIEYYL